MTTVRISKELILETLEKESLEAGAWINIASVKGRVWDPYVRPVYATTPARDPKCSVCAVGSVIRRVLSEKVTSYDVYKSCNYITEHADVATDDETIDENDVHDQASVYVDVNPLAALSIYFEGMNVAFDKHGDALSTDYVKKKVLQFVEDNFPAHIEVDVGEYEVAEGMEVV